MPRESWNTQLLIRKILKFEKRLRRDMLAAARRKPTLSDAYIADLIARAKWNMKWRPGETLKCSWRKETI